jgi:hypothetical protein
MEKLNLFGKVINKELKVENKQALFDWLENCEEGDDIVLKFVRQKDYKTVRQLRLIYKSFRIISETTGYETTEVKIMMKMRFGVCYSYIIEGKEITECKSLADFTKKDLSKFIEFIDNWAMKTLNLTILTNDDIKFLKNV